MPAGWTAVDRIDFGELQPPPACDCDCDCVKVCTCRGGNCAGGKSKQGMAKQVKRPTD